MVKNIVLSNGNVVEMGIEQVLTQFDKQIRRVIIEYIGFDAFEANEEDLMQSGRIQCWKAFKTYNEKNCFSTHLTWSLKGMLQQLVKNKKAQKRSVGDFKIVNIDAETSFDSSKSVQDYIADESVHFEDEFQNKELIKYLLENIDESEHPYLALNLGYTTVTKLAQKTGTSKANISYKNKRFKAKLAKILVDYNKNNF